MTNEQRHEHSLIKAQVRRQVCKAGRLLKKHCGFFYKSGNAASRILNEYRNMPCVTSGEDRYAGLPEYTKLFLEEWTTKEYAKFVVGVVTPPWYDTSFDLDKARTTLIQARIEVQQYLTKCYLKYEFYDCMRDYYSNSMKDNYYVITGLQDEIKTATLLSQKPRTF